MDDLAAQHLAWMKAEKQRPNTIARRAAVLRSIPSPGTATREQIEAWWASRRHLSPATRASDLTNLRTFYRWCLTWDHRTDDPTRRITAPRLDKGLPRPISRADLHHLLATLPDDLRRAVALGAYAGLRVAEAAALTWDDIDLETRRATVHGKGGKTRRVALGLILLDQIAPARPGCSVVTGEPRAMTAGQLQRRANRAIKAAGVDATFHQLRHRYGTVAYQATRDIVAVGQQLGHSSPVSTAIYAAASDEVADEIAAAVAR